MSGNGNVSGTAIEIQQIPAYDKISDLLGWVEKTGTMIAKAQFFGCKTIEQGQAMALISVTERVSILELRRRYHVVGGNLDMRADYMRSELRRLGGDYDWTKFGDDGIEARMWIEYRGRRHEVSYTIEDAKREDLIKKGSRWEKDPGSMLRARCSTKAIRAYCSEVLAGFVTDEERVALNDCEAGDIVDVPFEPAANSNPLLTWQNPPASSESKSTTAQQEPSAPQSAETADHCSTTEQRNKIRDLAEQLGDKIDVRGDVEAIGVSALRQVSASDAARMIDKYETIMRESASKESAEELAGESRVDFDATVVDADGPVGQVTIDELKTQIQQVLDYEGDAYKANIRRGLDKLTGKTNSSLSDLTIPQALKLSANLSKKLIDQRFK